MSEEIKAEVCSLNCEPIDIAIQINDNIAGEYHAMSGYTEFLADFAEHLQPGDADKIREIIGDEKNHAIILSAMVRKYDGNIVPASDDLKDALSALAAGVE
jgi:rubrerythrin